MSLGDGAGAKRTHRVRHIRIVDDQDPATADTQIKDVSSLPLPIRTSRSSKQSVSSDTASSTTSKPHEVKKSRKRLDEPPLHAPGKPARTSEPFVPRRRSPDRVGQPLSAKDAQRNEPSDVDDMVRASLIDQGCRKADDVRG